MMNELLTFLGVILAFLLRIGLPAGITMLIAWWLHKLDERWQEEARELKKTGEVDWFPLSIRAPCWQLLNCPPETRQKCPAYANLDIPCWQAFRDSRGWLLERCYACPVFREAPVHFVVAHSSETVSKEEIEH
jgi:hypothetical protein